MSALRESALVFGGCGFIGSALVRKLLDSEYGTVRVVDDLRHGFASNLPEDERVELQVAPAEGFELARNRLPSVIFYLCAEPFVPFSYSDPRAVYNGNVLSLGRFLDNVPTELPTRIVYASSGEVYGNVAQGEAEEAVTPLNGELCSPYSATRVQAERVVRSAVETKRLDVAVLRLFNTVGPRATHPYVVPDFISQAYHSRVIRHGDLSTIRDFVDVRDVARAFLLAGEGKYSDNRGAPGVFNVCTGIAVSIDEIAEAIERSLDLQCTRVLDRQRVRTRELHRLVGSPRRAHSVLGWAPEHSLAEMLDAAVNEYRRSPRWPYERR